MNEQSEKQIELLLKRSLPQFGAQVGAELKRDLWPTMLLLIDDNAPPITVSWVDWALLATVAAWLAFFPGAIPVLLYHL